MAVRPINVLSLCAGVGGLDLGIHIAEPGARTVAYLEREAFAAGRLVSRMQAGELDEAPIWADLTTFDARSWRGVVDCVASGDPCQPNSVAGKRLGADDDRFLADHVLRIIEECRPARFFRENVTGNADGQLAAFVPALEGLGYRVAAGIFSAAEAGASHQRERLFIMADADGGLAGDGYVQRGGQQRLLAQGNGVGGGHVAHPIGHFEAWRVAAAGEAPTGRAYGELGGSGGALVNPESIGRGEGRAEPELRSGRDAAARDGGELADACGTRPQGRELGGSCDHERDRPDAHGSTAELRRAWIPLCAPGPNDPRWPEILAGAPELEPALRRVADGMANRVDELRLCGNGVFPLAAALAWRSLSALLAAAGAEAGEPVLMGRAA